jgi:signal transduction histidine kinase
MAGKERGFLSSGKAIASSLGQRARNWRASVAPAALLWLSSLTTARANLENEGFNLRLSPAKFDLAHTALPLSLALIAITVYAAVISILHVRTRRQWNDHFEEMNRTTRDAQARAERTSLFLTADKQVLIAWGGPDGGAEFDGDPGLIVETTSPQRILSFSEWLAPEEARDLERHVHQLRSEGQAFSIDLRSLRGDLVEISGKPVAGRAVMAIRLVTGERLALARMQDEKFALEMAQKQLKSVLEALPQPVWLRDRAGKLGWVNAAYAQAVDASDPQLALQRQAEFLDSDDRALIRNAQAQQGRYRGAVTAIVAGQRRKVDVIEVAGPEGGGGMALDLSELEAARYALERQSEAHVRTLDELPTAVAIFDRRQQLTYSNRAFRDLFALDQVYLAGQPTNSELLDRLRSNGRLPEEPDYKAWKAGLLAQYASTESLQDGWNLPNGRALRVVISPNPQGGITYLFEDETERFTLATSYDQLKNMQWETLMALSEGVGVFGSDGLLQLSNPAFSRLWGIAPEALQGHPHVEELGRACRSCLGTVWREIVTVVCSLGEDRIEKRLEAITSDGRVLAIATTPLPDGATLVTASDVTDTVEAERRLREHNEALRQAARLRTDFIRSVSFELRSPLTSVVGLSQALAEGVAGPLTPKQAAYAQDIGRASDAVLALTSDILDLADVEGGPIEITRENVEIARAIQEAAEGLKDRLGEAKIRLAVNIANGISTIRADGTRLRHIMFNLLANAVSYSQAGDTVRLAVRREGANIVIEAHDSGHGDGLTGPQGSAAQGVERENGLRFSLAKALVLLHGGTIGIRDDARGGQITTVTLPEA